MRKRKWGNHSAPADVGLNITAMADIFTIILVFLLKSYTTGSLNITPAAGLMLPAEHGEKSALEALKVEVAENAVQIEDKPAVKLTQFRFEPGEIAKNGISNSLNTVFGRERKRQAIISGSNKAVKPDAKILILADRRTPYVTIKAVLVSAAVNGYTDFKLAVVAAE
jgi:biopolymer transport protein ExbD